MIAPTRLNGTPRPATHTERTHAASGGPAYASHGGVRSTGAATAGAPAQAMSSLATLVAVQAVEDRRHSRRRATMRGSRILDDLDALKLALLEGRVGRGELERMAHNIATAREITDDAELEALVDAIELRARVELAKRESL